MTLTRYFDLDRDVYKVQRRPQHSHLIINDGYDGIGVLDPLDPGAVCWLPFAIDTKEDLSIDAWCIRADGDALMTFNEENQLACLFDLRSNTCVRIGYPSWSIHEQMIYDWRGDTLWLREPRGLTFGMFKFVRSEIVFSMIDPFDVLQQNRGWRRASDYLSRIDAACVRVDANRAQCLFSAANGPMNEVGVIHWRDEYQRNVIELRTERPVPRLAGNDAEVILMYEYEVERRSLSGSLIETIAILDGFKYADVDVVTSDTAATLVLVGKTEDARLTSRFWLVHLTQ